MAITLIFFLFGLIFGSFANVCIWRIPRREGVVVKPSHCPDCGAAIKWHQNIPVISYLILRGKCSQCQKRISVQYSLVELSGGLLFAAAYLKFGLDWRLAGYLPFLWALLVISAIDIRHYIIPDILSFPGISLGLAFGMAGTFYPALNLSLFGFDDPFGFWPWLDSLTGILVGGGLIWLSAWGGEKIFKQEAMGGGDIKLAAFIGAFVGWQAVLMVLFLSFLLGTLAGVPLMLLGKLKKTSEVFDVQNQSQPAKAMVPFGPFLAMGAVIALLARKIIWGFYANLLMR
ncbi:prepilin peptidase [candidate division TA06 bacterium]|uniref:Prepilin peptidase n=1 Tax=candidate division TA06 bacterium TaxID=2250710 RepID=A0A933I7X9_UNCT6|nr:prepilin peptidase [candidate division TA06 bacterium]